MWRNEKGELTALQGVQTTIGVKELDGTEFEILSLIEETINTNFSVLEQGAIELVKRNIEEIMKADRLRMRFKFRLNLLENDVPVEDSEGKRS